MCAWCCAVGKVVEVVVFKQENFFLGSGVYMSEQLK